MATPSIVWFRNDLRLADNPALHAAVARGGPVIPVYVWAPHEEGEWPPGAAVRWWLHHSLESLRTDLDAVGSRLVIRRGDSLDVLREVIDGTGAEAVFWNRRYEPAITKRDTEIKQSLSDDGLDVESFGGNLLFEPWEVETKKGDPYRVFTAFWKSCLAREEPSEPLPPPDRLPTPDRWPDEVSVDSLGLLPELDWADGFGERWTPGTKGAAEHLARFLDGPVSRYADDRNRPDLVGSSRLSPHLHFGEIGPRTVWHETRDRGSSDGADTFLAEIGWRDFAHHVLYHFPRTTNEPMRDDFADFPWLEDDEQLKAWQRGRTGFPVVDAGMRELWATGWMHNRVRMIVASFLTKDLRISWLEGARWFWDTLVDASLPNNTLGWQWTAGCGADAAPYFRVFNPMSQGKRFDPDGDYIRRWVPEVAHLPDELLNEPWRATPPPEGYPPPLVDHAEARKKALDAFHGRT